MALKSVSRAATAAFAPTSQIVALGTAAGAIDLSFSSSAALELFALDLASGDGEMKLLGTATASDRFNRISWGTCGVGTESFPLGLVAGGCVDGTVNIWNPSKLASSQPADAEKSVVAKIAKHRGAVRGLEFNTQTPNLLASGAEDGELLIWDLTSPAAPSLLPPLQSAGGTSTGEISSVAWNHKVAHIIASTSFNGVSVVWDLRKQKQVISFADPLSRRRCSALQWNPDVATQLIVASDDDRFPALQVWDLRNATSPVKELASHTKGVVAMAWCPSDSGLLLTAGKDLRTICWETTTGEVLCELPSGSNWNFDVQWSPCVPGVLSASSFDGEVAIYNIESASKVSASDSDFGAAIASHGPSVGSTRAPNWLKRSSGASFGFGGQLAFFGSSSPQIHVASVLTDDSFVSRSEELQTAMAAADDKSLLKTFCELKASAASSAEDREIWTFLEVLFEDDARRRLLSHLNFQPAEEAATQELPPGGTAAADAALLSDQLQSGLHVAEPSAAAAAAAEGVQGAPGIAPKVGDEDFFENFDGSISAPPPPPPAAVVAAAEGADGGAADASAANGVVPFGGGFPDDDNDEDEEDGTEGVAEIQRALVVGNYELAVDRCLRSKRFADALVLASVGGAELWDKTQRWYMQRAQKKPYMKVVSAVVSGDLQSLVASRPLSEWKESLAILCTYASSQDWSVLCDDLATKLEASGDLLAATMCFMCAGSVSRVMEIWAAHLAAAASAGSSVPVELVQDVLEKSVVLGLATGQRHVSHSVAQLLADYSNKLAGQGRMRAAFDLLSLVPSEESSEEIQILRDRLYRSGQVDVSSVAPPTFPFLSEDVPIASPSFSSAATSTAYQQPAAAAPSYAQKPAATQSSNAYYQTPPPASSYSSYSSYQQPQPTPPTLPSPSLPPALPASPLPPQGPPAGPPQMFVPSAAAPSTFTPSGLPPTTFVPSAPQPPPTSAFVPSANPPPPPQPAFVPTAPPPVSFPSYSTATPAAAAAAAQPAQSSFSFDRSVTPTPHFTPTAPPPIAPPEAYGAAPSYPSAPPSHLPPSHSAPRPDQFTPVAARPPPAALSQPVAPPSSFPAAAPSAASAAAAAPAAAPTPQAAATVQTADTSNVAAELRPVVASLTRLFNEALQVLGGPAANPAKKREMDANSKKIGALFVKLNAGDISPSVSAKLQQLCQALDAGDFASALQIQVGLTTSDWEECSTWLTALKSLIKTRQMAR